MANCTECGAQLKDGIKFCTECGAAVPEGKAETAPASETQPQQPQKTEQQNAQPQQIPPQPQQQQQTYVPPQNAAPQQPYAQPQPAYAQPQPVYQQPAYAQPAPVYAQPAPVYAQPGQEPAPGPDSRYGLISTWGFIGIMLLLCIPIIGFILMIVWACGGCRKYQKRNLCRAMLIFMAVSLVISLILGFAIKGLVSSAIDTVKDQIGVSTGTEEDAGGLAGLFAGLTGDSSGSGNSSDTGTEDLLSGIFGGLLGGDLSGLLGEVDDINEEASKNSSGWPSDLPKYPDGSMNEVENYRTEITGTSADTMWSYIETLKNKGYKFQDFYQMGMSEADMKSMNAWWGTNGKWYLSISFVDGTVTVDHTTELPDLSGLFG